MWLFDKIFPVNKARQDNNTQIDEKIGNALISRWTEGKPLYHPTDFQAQLNNNIKWVYRACQLIADTASKVPFRLYTVKNSANQVRVFRHKSIDRNKVDWLEAHSPTIQHALKKSAKGELVEIQEHPVFDLMQNVNPHMNETDLKKLKWLSDRLTGNAYWYKIKDGTGRPVKIWPLPTQHVSIIPDRQTFIKGYELKVGTEKIYFDEHEIIHFKEPSPMNYFYGQSPMAAIVDSVTLQSYMDKFDRDLFFNKAMPETVLATDSTELTEPIAERILKKWKEKYNFLAGRTGEVALLSHGLKPYKLTMSPQELNYNEGQQRVMREILGIYGIPITKADPSEVRANNDAANAEFLADTIHPLLIRDQEKLNEKLLPDFDDRLIGAYDNPVPDDKDFQLKEDVALVKAGIKRRNEVRGKRGLEDLPPEDGDIVPPFSGGGQSLQIEGDIKSFADSIAKDVRRGIYGNM